MFHLTPPWGVRLSFGCLVLATGCSDYAFHAEKVVEDAAATTAQPQVVVSPDPVDFGTLDSVQAVTQTVTIGNTGQAELRLDAVRIDGASAFAVTDPEVETLPPGAQTTLVVSYAPTEDRADHDARLDVSSNAEGRPTASVRLLGSIAVFGTDSGTSGPDEAPACTCPEDFAPTEDGTMCFQQTEAPAAATGEEMEVCAVTPYPSYGKFGVLYPGGTNLRDSYWGQDDDTPNGRLNDVGVWSCRSTGASEAGVEPIASWIGFNVCVHVEADGDYLLGLGGDNRVRFQVDGIPFMEQPDSHTRNFNYWWMESISLTAGAHVLTIEGYNAGSIAGFGAELSGPFPAGSVIDDDAMQAANYADHIIWNTSDAIGSAFPIGDEVSWECPNGMVFNGCEEPICVSREVVPCL
ncbi:MAG: hypothetical protein CL927_07930 [Deltaproteobacteria bacterium]|nr:hypothetical protein [Deltaproteobacteria bacterium]HCH66336.1 hypothetical protein [Deltaproteobacteria bacterium]